ncbi:hypothetical protein SAMN05661096_00357 [Marivirga sericea]|uniref:DUF2062 domain-containing protein n=1 Tax=Marivirga sericea TaxID=1028 RepID=A0A1X7I8J9_9BACT|nr:DUF2062 domain-containing protein [Marivirga sericea]SMG10891.1 hypothetical protein SAMN05661096_00357 [Marivirga sericea]
MATAKLKRWAVRRLRFYKDKYIFKLKRYTIAILTSDKSDVSIALSYAFGTLIALLPTPGFSTAIGIGFITVFKQLNKMAVLLSMMVWNAITIIPIFWLSYKIGSRISNSLPDVEVQNETMRQILLFFKQFALGNLTLTIPISIGSYFLAILLLQLARKMRLRQTQRRGGITA